MARRRKANNNGKYRLRRPKDIREGVVNAYELVKEVYISEISSLYIKFNVLYFMYRVLMIQQIILLIWQKFNMTNMVSLEL